jgi:hypothetical protein
MAACLVAAAARPARAGTVVIESFENTLDGWSVGVQQSANFTNTGFSTTLGVTNGTYALSVGPTATNTGANPNYSIMLSSPAYGTAQAIALTQTLATATSISFDVYAPPASFGYYLQFEAATQTNAAGYPYAGLAANYSATNIGQETTLTTPITPAENATFAADAAQGISTLLDLQVGGGYTAGNETFEIDNVVATVPDAAPEPTSLALFGAAGVGLASRRRARRQICTRGS